MKKIELKKEYYYEIFCNNMGDIPNYKVVKYLGLNPTFLAYYTIELILLYKGKKVLKDYLKKRDMSVNDVLKNIQNAYNASLEYTFSK